jgi:hypothetical protein
VVATKLAAQQLTLRHASIRCECAIGGCGRRPGDRWVTLRAPLRSGGWIRPIGGVARNRPRPERDLIRACRRRGPSQYCPSSASSGEAEGDIGRSAASDDEGYTEIGDVAEVVLGVDTHLDFHVAVARDGLGRRLGELAVSTTTKGYERLVC